MVEVLTHNQAFASPQDALAHYGVKGMKWGVRKDTGPAGELVLSQECRNGTQLNVYKDSRFSNDVDVKADLYHTFEFRDRSGAKVGQASFYKEKAESTSLELEWIGVDKAHRSNGYARAALNGVMEYSRQNGITDLEMSATKMGQPLYESLGFTRVPGKLGTDRRVLGVFKTLPRYQLHIPAEVAHSGSVKSLLDYIAKAVDNDPELNEVEHSEFFEDALAHYGVKGMKWGVRKGDKGGRSASPKQEKRQAKRNAKADLNEIKAAKNAVYIQELKDERAKTKPGIRGALARNAIDTQIVESQKYQNSLTKEAAQLRSGKLTTTQKQYLVGGALLTVGVLAVYGSTKVESGEFNALKMRGRALATGNKDIFQTNPKFRGKMSVDDVTSKVLPGINPGYSSNGGKMNCRRCSLTYELRRRGFDVAATTSPNGIGQSETGLINALTPGQRNLNRTDSLSAMVRSGVGIRGQARGDVRRRTGDSATVKDAKDRQAFFNTLGKQPDGARGEAVFNFGGFGHSLSYERFGDKTYIFDTQKGQRYDVGKPDEYNSFLTKWGMDNVKDIQITRLDNVPLDHKFLARWAKDNPKPKKGSR